MRALFHELPLVREIYRELGWFVFRHDASSSLILIHHRGLWAQIDEGSATRTEEAEAKKIVGALDEAARSGVTGICQLECASREGALVSVRVVALTGICEVCSRHGSRTPLDFDHDTCAPLLAWAMLCSRPECRGKAAELRLKDPQFQGYKYRPPKPVKAEKGWLDKIRKAIA